MDAARIDFSGIELFQEDSEILLLQISLFRLVSLNLSAWVTQIGQTHVVNFN